MDIIDILDSSVDVTGLSIMTNPASITRRLKPAQVMTVREASAVAKEMRLEADRLNRAAQALENTIIDHAGRY